MVHAGIALLRALPAVVIYTWHLPSTNVFYEFCIPCKMQLGAHIHIYIDYFPQDTHRTNTTEIYIFFPLQQKPDRHQFYHGLMLAALQTDSNQIMSHTF